MLAKVAWVVGSPWIAPWRARHLPLALCRLRHCWRGGGRETVGHLMLLRWWRCRLHRGGTCVYMHTGLLELWLLHRCLRQHPCETSPGICGHALRRARGLLVIGWQAVASCLRRCLRANRGGWQWLGRDGVHGLVGAPWQLDGAIELVDSDPPVVNPPLVPGSVAHCLYASCLQLEKKTPRWSLPSTTWRLLCSSFLVMTCFTNGEDTTLLPERELT